MARRVQEAGGDRRRRRAHPCEPYDGLAHAIRIATEVCSVQALLVRAGAVLAGVEALLRARHAAVAAHAVRGAAAAAAGGTAVGGAVGNGTRAAAHSGAAASAGAAARLRAELLLLAAHVAVPEVFDGVVRAARQALRDLCPPVAQLLLHRDDVLPLHARAARISAEAWGLCDTPATGACAQRVVLWSAQRGQAQALQRKVDWMCGAACRQRMEVSRAVRAMNPWLCAIRAGAAPPRERTGPS